MAHEVDDAGLHRGLGEGRRDRLGKALQPVHDGDETVLDAPVAQLVHDAEGSVRGDGVISGAPTVASEVERAPPLASSIAVATGTIG